MAYKDLQEFLKLLEKKGELKRIAAPLAPYLEIAEVTDRVSKAVGPALLFEKPKDARFPVLTNMYGSYKRMNMALDSENLDELGERIEAMQAMQRTLLTLIECCQGDDRPHCPILDDLGGLSSPCSHSPHEKE